MDSQTNVRIMVSLCRLSTHNGSHYSPALYGQSRGIWWSCRCIISNSHKTQYSQFWRCIHHPHSLQHPMAERLEIRVQTVIDVPPQEIALSDWNNMLGYRWRFKLRGKSLKAYLVDHLYSHKYLLQLCRRRKSFELNSAVSTPTSGTRVGFGFQPGEKLREVDWAPSSARLR